MKEFSALDVQVKNEDRSVVVRWADGHMSTIPIQRLRGYCPCAQCQGHGTKLKFVKNRTNGIFSASPVGRYAISFRFSDGHSTGIFRWEQLRKLDPSEASRWGVYV